ncbi:MAG: DNA-directed RNA polymerase subunit beta', partial [Candidatus Margulisbacteria bacterium]|nr:DNA-directed RNA polymerase subunit beta' [Candidatus Margulisiibacteriota bacterium]
VMPPDLRPMVQLEGGRFATSDLNDLYRRVVNRNNRLKRLLDIGAPNMIIRNEKRMLQEAVDVLIDNGRRGRAVTGSNGRPLKSLSDIIEGKQGRFRQNLLGKRVDYSGRSVIVVGPHLKLHQCGLPKEMAIELFKPFIIRKLVERGHVQNVKSAKRKIEAKDVVVYDVLDEVIKGHPVMLNRAPTLHRLGIQAFEPILVEGKAIQIHPLVCTAFNADFDGDQMAIHVPLSMEAQTEARLLMLASNNLLSPSNGAPIITPTQDMVIGIYYLTITTDDKRKGDGKAFASDNEALLAYEHKAVDLHAKIKIRKGGEKIETTPGRLIFNATVNQVVENFRRQKIPYINFAIGKKQLAKIINEWYRTYGSTITAELCDKLKDLGYSFATKAGISISIEDLVVPEEKKKILARAEGDVDKVENLYKHGSLSLREMKERNQEIWRSATAEITSAMIKKFAPMNNVNMMATSGARGNIDQVRQLAGMRGLMADASGNTVDIPIKTNFREGLNMTEYFISSYGARKGLVDTALRTADSGYLTRRLVDVVQDVMITEENCQTKDYIELKAIKDGYETVVTLAERLAGKTAFEKITDPISGELLVNKGDEITEENAEKIQAAGLEIVKVRSVLTCRTRKGVCQKCYGRDLSRDRTINIGEAVGIIAAQSIGEPGTQLTMRTFHTGGVDLSKAARVEIRASHDGKITLEDALKPKKIKDEFGNTIVVAAREGKVILKRSKGNDLTYVIPAGAELMVKDGQSVEVGDVIAGHDPSYEFVISGTEGTVQYIALDVKETKSERVARKDGEIFVYNPKVKREYKITEGKEVFVQDGMRVKAEQELATDVPAETAGIILKIETKKTADNVIKEATILVSPGESYPILAGARMLVADGDTVDADDILARESSAGTEAAKARDIVAGLPRVEELFEARRPKSFALLSEIDGVAEILEKDGMRAIAISHGKIKKEYKVPYGVRLKVFPGKKVQKGDYLTEGIKDPHDILKINGVRETQLYLSEEIQKVYRQQGVKINEKHIEVIIRQMTNKCRITSMGDSDFLIGDLVDIFHFEEINNVMKEKGKGPATADRALLGITKSSLNTESVFSAASFQETTSVLTLAAIKGKSDPMYGLKENVIIG